MATPHEEASVPMTPVERFSLHGKHRVALVPIHAGIDEMIGPKLRFPTLFCGGQLAIYILDVRRNLVSVLVVEHGSVRDSMVELQGSRHPLEVKLFPFP